MLRQHSNSQSQQASDALDRAVTGIAHQTIVRWLNQGRWDGRVMWHVWDRIESAGGGGNPKERNFLKFLRVMRGQY